MRKKILIVSVVVAALLAVYAAFLYSQRHQTKDMAEPSEVSAAESHDFLDAEPIADAEISDFSKKIDMKKWLHNATDRVYYQLEIPYCGMPENKELEKLAIFVPEKFFKCKANPDKSTYSCKPNDAAYVAGYTIHKAPIVMPVETLDYGAIPALKEYRNVAPYTDAGYVYVHVGSRGIEAAAPAAVVDFKAAIRFLRHNKANIPANTDLIFAFGVGGGGTVSAILGTSGDSALYQSYLHDLGAIETSGDSINGVLTWYPTADFGIENSAYEWSIGVSRTGITQNQHTFSNLLARNFVNYINNSGFISPKDKPLFLQPSEKGVYKAGPYYDYVKVLLENSLTKFLRKTAFPYTPPRRKYAFGIGFTDAVGEINPQGTFLTVRQYTKALNEKRNWVDYNYSFQTAEIRSVEDFLHSFKPATQNIAYLDPINRSSLMNKMFRTADAKGAHFDDNLAKIYQNNPVAQEYSDDLVKQDAHGHTVRQRRDMYSPLYYLIPSSVGYRTSKVAPFWRIRGGFQQTDNSLVNEINLDLALQKYPNVKYSDLEMFWAQEQKDLNEDNTVPPQIVIELITGIYLSEIPIY